MQLPNVTIVGLPMNLVVLPTLTKAHVVGLYVPQSAISANLVTLMKQEKDVEIVLNTAFLVALWVLYLHVTPATTVLITILKIGRKVLVVFRMLCNTPNGSDRKFKKL